MCVSPGHSQCGFVTLQRSVYLHDQARGPDCSLLSQLPALQSALQFQGAEAGRSHISFCFSIALPKRSCSLTISCEPQVFPGCVEKVPRAGYLETRESRGTHTHTRVFCSSQWGVEGSEQSHLVFLAQVTLDRGLINGITFMGTCVRHFDMCKSFV